MISEAFYLFHRRLHERSQYRRREGRHTNQARPHPLVENLTLIYPILQRDSSRPQSLVGQSVMDPIAVHGRSSPLVVMDHPVMKPVLHGDCPRPHGVASQQVMMAAVVHRHCPRLPNIAVHPSVDAVLQRHCPRRSLTHHRIVHVIAVINRPLDLDSPIVRLHLLDLLQRYCPGHLDLSSQFPLYAVIPRSRTGFGDLGPMIHLSRIHVPTYGSAAIHQERFVPIRQRRRPIESQRVFLPEVSLSRACWDCLREHEQRSVVGLWDQGPVVAEGCQQGELEVFASLVQLLDVQGRVLGAQGGVLTRRKDCFKDNVASRNT